LQDDIFLILGQEACRYWLRFSFDCCNRQEELLAHVELF